MKYITTYKLFESVDDIQLYKCIDPQEFDESLYYVNDNQILSYKEDLLRLNEEESKYLKDIGVITNYNSGYPEYKPHYTKLVFDNPSFKYRRHIFIFKSSDEWYYIDDDLNRVLYKCDTFEGVKQVIKLLDK